MYHSEPRFRIISPTVASVVCLLVLSCHAERRLRTDLVDADASSDTGRDSGGDGDGDGDSDVDVDVDGDGDEDAEADADDAEEQCPGHPEMVLIPGLGVCIDRYEASRGEGGVARSVEGVMPWGSIRWNAAVDACEAAGKRLCGDDEWVAACRGPDGDRYPYGDVFEVGRCHDASYESTAPMVTGSFPDCEGGVDGLFDINGNMWEWTARCSEDWCNLRGGSYNNGPDDMRCGAADDARSIHTAVNLGFRCCWTVDG